MSRLEFVSFTRKEGANMRQLCRNYGISPTTGYKWLKRYERGREAALRDRSRRPRETGILACGKACSRAGCRCHLGLELEFIASNS